MLSAVSPRMLEPGVGLERVLLITGDIVKTVTVDPTRLARPGNAWTNHLLAPDLEVRPC